MVITKILFVDHAAKGCDSRLLVNVIKLPLCHINVINELFLFGGLSTFTFLAFLWYINLTILSI